MPGGADDFAYLLSSTVYVAFILVAARRTLPAPAYRLTIRSGWFGLPAGALAPFFEGSYWSPERLGGGVVGIEDGIISFAAAATTWYLVALRYPAPSSRGEGAAGMAGRLSVAGGAAVATFVAAWYLLADPMMAALVSCVVTTGGLLVLRPAHASVAAWGALTFAAAWFALVRLIFLVFPAFVEQWNPATIWGVRFAGVPLGEVAWAAAFGAFWSVVALYVFDPAAPRGLGTQVLGGHASVRKTRNLRELPRRR